MPREERADRKELLANLNLGFSDYQEIQLILLLKLQTSASYTLAGIQITLGSC